MKVEKEDEFRRGRNVREDGKGDEEEGRGEKDKK
jgi:hypothetical protein